MGWCSATTIFDAMCKYLLESTRPDEEKVADLKVLAEQLEDGDWDCQQDSDYYDHPVVRRVFQELHPDWEELQD